MWAGWKHDNMKLPVITAGGLGGTLETGRSLDYLYDGDDNRKVCSLYLSIMDRNGSEAGSLRRRGDAAGPSVRFSGTRLRRRGRSQPHPRTSQAKATADPADCPRAV